MTGTLCAAIDIGSNSVKLLVGRPTGGAVDVVADVVTVTRLSAGVDATGHLDPAASVRTLDALRTFMSRCGELNVGQIAAVGTAVLRDAEDGDDFLAACRAFGLEVEIVSGDVEAQIVRLAATHEIGAPPDAVLIDIGGGSTELIWADGQQSTELGVVRMTERHIDRDPPGEAGVERLIAAIDRRLDRVDLPQASSLVGSSASCSLLARLHSARHDPQGIHGYRLPLADLETIVSQLAAQTQAERVAWPGMDLGRADVLLAGAVVLARVARRVGAKDIQINDRGTRYGIFHRAFMVTD